MTAVIQEAYIQGVYQHRDERHLHRYGAAFDFRHNNPIKLGLDDKARSDNILPLTV